MMIEKEGGGDPSVIPHTCMRRGVVDNICLFNSKELGGLLSQNKSLLLLLYNTQGLRFVHTLKRKLWQINVYVLSFVAGARKT